MNFIKTQTNRPSVRPLEFGAKLDRTKLRTDDEIRTDLAQQLTAAYRAQQERWQCQ